MWNKDKISTTGTCFEKKQVSPKMFNNHNLWNNCTLWNKDNLWNSPKMWNMPQDVEQRLWATLASEFGLSTGFCR